MLNQGNGRARALKPWVICDATVDCIADIAEGDIEAVKEVIKHVEKQELTVKQAKTVETLAPIEFEAHTQRSEDTLRAIAGDRRRLVKLIEILRVAAREEEEAAMVALLLSL